MKKLSTIFLHLLFLPALHAQQDGVSTQGQCVRKVIPDRAQITVTSQEISMNAKEARSRAADKIEKLRKAVKKLELPNLELETTEASLYPQQEWENNRSVMKGYRAAYGIRISTSSFERMGEVMDAAVNAGIKNVGQLGSYLSPELLKKEQKACLEKATLDAKEKAEILASSLGAKLGKVLRITQGGSTPGPIFQPMRMAKTMAMEADAAGSSPSFDPGSQDIHVNVDVSFALHN